MGEGACEPCSSRPFSTLEIPAAAAPAPGRAPRGHGGWRGGGVRGPGLHCPPGAAGLSPLNRGQECSQLQTHPLPSPSRVGRWRGREAAGGLRAEGAGQARAGRARPQPSQHREAEPELVFQLQAAKLRPGPPAQGARGGEEWRLTAPAPRHAGAPSPSGETEGPAPRRLPAALPAAQEQTFAVSSPRTGAASPPP